MPHRFDTVLADRLVTLFQEFQVADVCHGKRSLLTHLLGTFSLLERWGGTQELVLAGLCHSVLGTAAYERPELRATAAGAERLRWAIGDEAAALVANYRVMTWRTVVAACRGVSGPFPVMLREMATLHAANLVEQWTAVKQHTAPAQLAQYVNESRDLLPFLPSAAAAAVRAIIT